MEFDFCLVASWSTQSHRQTVVWAAELRARGYDVAVVSPVSSPQLSESDSRCFILSADEMQTDALPSVAEIESRHGIPSLDHLVFTERLYFNLSRKEALARAVRLAATIGDLFSEHSVKYTFQVRGPEIHRLLAHYITEQEGGTSIWGGFSPFDDRFGLTTSLDGSWDSYETVPYEDIPDADRVETRRQIEQFREEQQFYAHDDEDAGDETGTNTSAVEEIVGQIRRVVDRDRPGRLRDQILPELRLEAASRLNRQLLPTVEESRRLCRNTKYVFFPLQYQIESRLTVFSPQFYDQSFLIEYLGRVLPSTTQLFVKGHPNHPGRPSPRTIRSLREKNRITFLHNDQNAHEVIEHAEAVVAINNTVGYETIYHQKPLLALGESPYAETPAVTSVDSLEALPEILSDRVSTTVPEEKVVESIYSLRKACFPGDRSSYDDDDVRELITSVLEFAESSDQFDAADHI